MPYSVKPIGFFDLAGLPARFMFPLRLVSGGRIKKRAALQLVAGA